MARGKKTLEELQEQLFYDPGNYRLNVEMGFYYLDHDRKMTYKYLKRALSFCDSQTDTGAIEQLFSDMEYVYPELMEGMEGLLSMLDEKPDAVFSAVAAGVETHGVAHIIEEKYTKAQVTWYVDMAQVKYYNHQLDYVFMDADECLGSYPGIILNAIRNALKDDGALIMRVGNAAWYGRLYKLLQGENPDAVNEKSLSHAYLRNEIEDVLKRSGFDVIFSAKKPDVPARDAQILKDIIYNISEKMKCADINEFTNRYYLIKAVRREKD